MSPEICLDCGDLASLSMAVRGVRRYWCGPCGVSWVWPESQTEARSAVPLSEVASLSRRQRRKLRGPGKALPILAKPSGSGVANAD